MPDFSITVALTALASIAILAFAGLRGFSDWIQLKRAELDLRREGVSAPSLTSRIEIADLKERLRKLEALAAGVEL